PERLVRVHLLRALAEKAKLDPKERDVASAALRDADAFVQRAAAETLAAHPAPANLPALVEAFKKAPAADAQLVHVIRMAIRDQLRLPEAWAALDPSWPLADICLGIPKAESAIWLQKYLQAANEPFAKVQRYIHHVARYAPDDGGAWVFQWSSQK